MDDAYIRMLLDMLALHMLECVQVSLGLSITQLYIVPGFPIYQAPYRWRHADLTQIKAFLKDRVADGTYVPIFPDGLD